MRPVDKGAAPADYACYQNASVDLRCRLGDYCSYCERQMRPTWLLSMFRRRFNALT